MLVIGKMNYMGAAKCLYCVVKFKDVSGLKIEAGESINVSYVSTFYNYNIGDRLLLV